MGITKLQNGITGVGLSRTYKLTVRHTIQTYRADTKYKLTVRQTIQYKGSPRGPQGIPKGSPRGPQGLPKGSPRDPQDAPSKGPQGVPKRSQGAPRGPRFTIGHQFTGLATSPGLPRGQPGEGPGLPRGWPRFRAMPRFNPGLAPVYVAST